MKKFNTLDKKWKELLYAFSGFGPNLLMVLMGAFFTDAINPAALENDSLLVSSHIVGGVSLIVPAIFPALWAASKAFDGIIDVPLGALTDNLNTKWGKRRIPIIVSFPIMVLAYFCCWMPLATDSQIINTIWITSWALVFFSTYTMCLIAFYGSLSTVCINESQRTRVSSYKAFFDTISYCLVYALVPLILEGTKLHIDQFTLLLLPLMGSILIPVFMIKEGEKFEKEAIEAGYDITPLAEEPKFCIWQSIKTAFKNKPFINWIIVNCCAFFGLQMFLVSMNVLIYTGMGFNGGGMAILNTFAFAPVPIMLFIFNKIKAKKGIRFAYQLALVSFAISILSFVFASKFVMGDDNVMLQYIIGCVGGIFGSFGIGAFFMVPYLIPTQIAVVEEKIIGKNITAMFVAVQALTSSIIGAISGGLVYEKIKMYFFTVESKFGIVWA